MNSSCGQSQFISKLKNGNHESFLMLYKQYGNKIFNLALKMTGSRDDAEDITQSTFLQAYNSIDKFREESSIYTWIYAIAKNICVRFLNGKRKASFHSLDELIHTVQTPDAVKGLDEIEKQFYINQVREGCLMGLLRCLSFYQRIAFILSVLLQVEVKDVALIINKSEAATRTLIHRARNNIKDFLCKNCSLYDHNNSCHCENLIEFSLKKGWIRKASKVNLSELSNITPVKIEQEIKSIKKIVMLYNTLKDEEPSDNMVHSIKKVIKKQNLKIFSRQKVK